MSQPDNGTQVRTDSIIGGIIHKHSYGIGMFLHRLFHLAGLHSQRNPQRPIDLRIHIHRNRPAEYQGIDHTFMYISGQDDLVSRFADR